MVTATLQIQSRPFAVAVLYQSFLVLMRFCIWRSQGAFLGWNLTQILSTEGQNLHCGCIWSWIGYGPISFPSFCSCSPVSVFPGSGEILHLKKPRGLFRLKSDSNLVHRTSDSVLWLQLKLFRRRTRFILVLLQLRSCVNFSWFWGDSAFEKGKGPFQSEILLISGPVKVRVCTVAAVVAALTQLHLEILSLRALFSCHND